MWKGLLAPTFSSSETAAATAVLTLGKEGGETKKKKKKQLQKEKDRLLLLTYSWTALNCCVRESQQKSFNL